MTHTHPFLERVRTLTISKMIPARNAPWRGLRARTKAWLVDEPDTCHYRYCVQIKNRLQTCLLEQPASWCAEGLHTSSSAPFLLGSASCAPDGPLVGHFSNQSISLPSSASDSPPALLSSRHTPSYTSTSILLFFTQTLSTRRLGQGRVLA